MADVLVDIPGEFIELLLAIELEAKVDSFDIEAEVLAAGDWLIPFELAGGGRPEEDPRALGDTSEPDTEGVGFPG